MPVNVSRPDPAESFVEMRDGPPSKESRQAAGEPFTAAQRARQYPGVLASAWTGSA
jgi:hypothetical protein